MDRRLTVALLAVYLAAVAWVTLRPDLAPDSTFDAVRAAVDWLRERGVPVTFDLVEALANVVMFVPFGLLVGRLQRRTWLVVAAGCGTSALIETLQLAFLPTRVATVQDVVMNTLGAAVGVVALRLAARRRPG